MTPIEAVLVGAGGRGREAFGAFALRNPKLLKFIAVADPDEDRRNKFAGLHKIPQERRFVSWEEAASKPQMAPIAFNATLDATHIASSLALLKKGYHLFLEKPMATTPQECLQIADAAAKHKRMVQICHSLRFTPFYTMLKKVLDSGVIGRIVSMSLAENVCYWHFAHSFVRGNWRRVDETGPLILTKCCHDMDLATWLADSRVDTVASQGMIALFRRENEPEGAADRCLDGCKAVDTCPFNAAKFYLGRYNQWPVDVISLDTSLAARRRAIEEGPYGRCVFRCDNTTVDQQAVTATFENGILMDFVVRAGSALPCRTVRIIGTRGELNGHFEKSTVRVQLFKAGMSNAVYKAGVTAVHKSPAGLGSHGGGDEGAVRHFLKRYAGNEVDVLKRSLDIAVEGHLLSFAAEKARTSAKLVKMAEFRAKCGAAK